MKPCLHSKSFVAAVAMSTIGLIAGAARAQMTFTNNVINAGDGQNVTYDVGANTFYSAGYTGTGAVVSNIEGGLFYKYHQTLATDTIQLAYGGGTLPTLGPNASDPSSPNAVNDPNLTNDPNWSLYDEHATSVAGVLAGAPEYPGDPRAGIAYGTTLVSGAISTGWIGGPYSESFNASDLSFITPYVEALQTGIPELGGSLSNVTNGSYGYIDPVFGSSGSDTYTVALDGLAKSSGATMVWAAGNGGYGAGNVNAPAAGYNGISVGALDGSTYYTSVISFSSGGPSNYVAPDGTTIVGARATVDIVAPGETIDTPLYAGATGGNLGATPPTYPLPPDWTTAYGGLESGTSFAAPIVAGGAALLVDAGKVLYGGGDSINGNVIKAVLMNSATKIAGWNNGQTLINGVVTTSQALDYSSGSGALNLTQAYTQYTAGVNDISHGAAMAGPARGVTTVGWDYGFLVPSASQSNPYNDYYFGTALVGGSTFNATLTWYVDDAYDGLDDSSGTPTITSSQLRFTNLDLEVWQVVDGVPTDMVGLSDAEYISTQELSFEIPETGDYMLRVFWAGDQYDVDNSDSQGQYYGLAWDGVTNGIVSSGLAPESSSLLLLISGAGFVVVWVVVRTWRGNEPGIA